MSHYEMPSEGKSALNELDKVRDQLKTVRGQVLWLLEHFPSTRDSDFILTLMFYREIYGLPFPYVDFKTLRDLPQMESIRRVRQKIQNEEHLFPPTEEVIISRRKRERVMRKWSVEDKGYGSEDD